jgi:hypothetical protein
MGSYYDFPADGKTDTSAAAAAGLAPVAGRLRKLTLDAVRNAGPRGMTADEIAEALSIDKLSIRPRATELRALGHIRDSGYRRLNAGMKKMIVWTAVGGAE